MGDPRRRDQGTEDSGIMPRFPARGYPHVVRRKSAESVQDLDQTKRRVLSLERSLAVAQDDIAALERSLAALDARVVVLESA